ncbi:MAG TPA: glycosyltransferase [Candidatus Didemnitutus sp.]|jgi:glycosyltransferase involved in cell wall biosynthesis
MNVLLVSEPGENGVFRYVDGLARFLIARGIGVHLAYSDRRRCDQLDDLVDCVRRHGGTTLNLATGNAPALSDLPALFSLLALARRLRPDVIHSHSSKAGVLARLLAMFGIRSRQVYHPHAYSGMRVQSTLQHVVYDTLEQALGFCGTTVNVSPDEEAYAREFLRLPADRIVRIPNGIDPAVFRPPSALEKAALRRELELPPGAVILGTLGRAAPQKDPVTLYRAFGRALASHPGLVLFHLGCGELDAELDQLAAEPPLAGHVVRRHFLATPEKFYRAVDGFILTSLYEGLSLAALEALACDLPLILSEAPGNHALLELGLSHAYSAPVGDSDAFARQIARWAAESARRSRRSNHRVHALEDFDSRHCFHQVLELYEHAQPSGFRAAI